MYQKIIQELNKLKNSAQAKNLQRFFKTGKGEYGAGDIFLGLKASQTRGIVKKYFKEADLSDAQKLLNSKIHEHRMAGALILVEHYKQASQEIQQDPSWSRDRGTTRDDIFSFYLKNARNINNWDLVDLSAPNIVGQFLFQTRFSGGLSEKETSTTCPSVRREVGKKTSTTCPSVRREVGKNLILYKLAKSKNLWERRMAIIATLTFIREKQFQDTIKISEILLKDKHDLIHKAVGWMLREIGKRDEQTLIEFLDKNILAMPRAMLRYAIEKLPEKKRQYYLNKK